MKVENLDLFFENRQKMVSWKDIKHIALDDKEVIDGVEIYRFRFNMDRSLDQVNDSLNVSQQAYGSFVPWHFHDYMEIMYAYKGSCEVLLVDDRISLDEGNLLIIDKRTCHRVEEVKKGNIILNLVIKKDYLTKHLLNRLSKNSLITHFMLQSIKNKKFEKSYLMFMTKKQDEPVHLLDRILLEYYNLREFSEEIIDSYMAVFFIELIRGHFIEKVTKPENKAADKYTTIDFLQYIERNYQEDSLNKMAAHFNYHPNYLSNRLKTEIGKSYMELLQLQKMAVATVLLSSTELNVDEIVTEIGYSSTSFFYKKFKDFHGETPQKFRANL